MQQKYNATVEVSNEGELTVHFIDPSNSLCDVDLSVDGVGNLLATKEGGFAGNVQCFAQNQDVKQDYCIGSLVIGKRSDDVVALNHWDNTLTAANGYHYAFQIIVTTD